MRKLIISFEAAKEFSEFKDTTYPSYFTLKIAGF